MLIDSYMRAQLMELRAREQMAAAERSRLAREARPRAAWRLAAVRLAARGLRVEREIEFGPVRLPGR